MICRLCPRNCGAERTEAVSGGVCAMPALPVAARAMLHQWEEPCLTGERGAGTVFFSGCNLRCVFCQNAPISQEGAGRPVTVSRLREIFHELIAQGAACLDLVTPTHFTLPILEALGEEPGLTVRAVELKEEDAGRLTVYLDWQGEELTAQVKV